MGKIAYVNTRQGSRSFPHFSGGATLPFTQLPFAMAGFVPQTSGANEPWFYFPDHHVLEGVRLTHQPSVWLGDYGTFLMTPQCGTLPANQAAAACSSYRPSEAELHPDYLKLEFARWKAVFELTPSQRGGNLRLRFSGERQPFLSILPVQGEYGYWVDYAKQEVHGYTTGAGIGRSTGFCMRFVLRFQGNVLDPGQTRIFTKEDAPPEPGSSVSGGRCGIHIAFCEKEAEAELAVSYISEEQALRNLTGRDFHFNRRQAESIWEEHLSRIEIETDSGEQMKTFYSCLYRTFLFPHKCYELDENGQAVHFCPEDGKVRKGVRYTDNGFWDTHRTVYPLFSLIAPEEYREILEGFIQDYKDAGWLPRWTVMGETGCMPGSLIDAVIADAAVKGIIGGELLETAFRGMLHHANHAAGDVRQGRGGIAAYLEYGYVPYDAEQPGVNLTLDHAYGDFCIAQVAQVLGRTELEAEYRRRSENYRNVFDPETGFMRARNSAGSFRPDFDPFDWGGDYCEGGAWQHSFYVPHDIDGLAALYGGKQKLIEKLDLLFSTPPHYNTGAYGFLIHEMAEMAEADFGQCAISNQPSFHIPFLYAAVGAGEKTDMWVEKIAFEAFSSDVDGFPGDEDNGTMAAWYIFSCLGLYPLCPGKAEYVKSNMLVKKARILGKYWDNSRFGPMIAHQKIIK